MSHQTGIKSNDTLRNFFAKSKEGQIRLLKVSIAHEELTLDTHREVKSSDWRKDYESMVLAATEPTMPCYLFFRLDERQGRNYAWLLICWSPDHAPIKQKMLYAATKSTLKLEFGAGEIKDELFGTARDDITLDGFMRHVTSQLAPAPLTNREEELEILKQAENLTRINVDTKHKTLQGVMFPLDSKAVDGLSALRRDEIDYLKLEIDIKAERILLDKALERLTVDGLVREIPVDKARFHIFRYGHVHGGERFRSIVFIYSMPGFSCSVKERMVYSSTKSELLDFLRSAQGGALDIGKTFEISEPGEISEAVLVEELHPKKAEDTRKFEKPKGPVSRGPKRVTRPSGGGAAALSSHGNYGDFEDN
jgi:twinfilin-like protein